MISLKVRTKSGDGPPEGSGAVFIAKAQPSRQVKATSNFIVEAAMCQEAEETTTKTSTTRLLFMTCEVQASSGFVSVLRAHMHYKR